MAVKTCLPFYKFGEDLAKGAHIFGTHVFKAYLANAVVNQSTHTVKADVAEIATGNGYSGPWTVAITVSRTGATTKLVGADPTTLTASGGAVATFRALVFYNDTPTSPADPLISAWDYCGSVSLQDGESFPIDFDDTNGIFQVTVSSAP